MTFNLSDHVRSQEHKNLSGRLRPSGRFSFAQVFPKKKKVLNNGKVQSEISQSLRTVQELDDAYQRLLGGEVPPLREVPPGSPGESGAIGSSIANNSQSRSPRGSKGITASARDVLCWSANQLERVYGRRNMSFLTLTLPPLSEEHLKVVQGAWSKIVNSVQDEIKKELEKNGVQTSIAGCTELQLERGEHTGLRWPHLHLVFRGRRDALSGWALSPSGVREIWSRVVGRVVPSGAYSWASSENLQQVNRSSGGYLAKYISKGQSKGSPAVRDNWHPSDWIVCSRRLRGLYKTLTISGYDIACALAYVCKHWERGMGYKQPVVISTPAYGDRVIGQWGWLKGEAIFLSPQEWFAVVE
jgi:hypothetical protein